MKDDQINQVYEIQRELVAAQTKINFYSSSQFALKKNSEKAKISIREIQALGPEHKTYRPLGKAFILKDPKDIIKDLEQTITSNLKEAEENDKYRQHFEGKFKELEKQLRESMSGLKLQ
mmetsp:Transcript_21410/g.24877  ORF Transcript_21410/g.24877 Transcript_21410/m.24877 type:complete len:119 (+) Transcript_21410:49-405(+)